jgi:hypothetical protein
MKILASFILSFFSLTIGYTQTVTERINKHLDMLEFAEAQALFKSKTDGIPSTDQHIVESTIYQRLTKALMNGTYVDRKTMLTPLQSCIEADRAFKRGRYYAGQRTGNDLRNLAGLYIDVYNYYIGRNEHATALQHLNNAEKLYDWDPDPGKYNMAYDSNKAPFLAQIREEQKKLTEFLAQNNAHEKEKKYIEQILKAKKDNNKTEWFNLIYKARTEFPSDYNFIALESEYLQETGASSMAMKRFLKKANTDCPDSIGIVLNLAQLLFEEAVEENETGFAPGYFSDVNILLYKYIPKQPKNSQLKLMALEVHTRLLDTYIQKNDPAYSAAIKENAVKAKELCTTLLLDKSLGQEELKNLQQTKDQLAALLAKYS